MISMIDFMKLEKAFNSSKSSAKIAIQLTARTGLRVSECTKLQGRDINLKDNVIHVEDGKGGRNRDVPIRAEDRNYFADLKANIGDMERVCPVRSDSINKAIDRAMKGEGIRNKYADTSIHCIRKMYAQKEYDMYDKELNDIYALLKKELSPEVMKSLQAEEIKWIEQKEAKAKKEASQYEGGTLAPVVYISSLYESTKERCYDLVNRYMTD